MEEENWLVTRAATLCVHPPKWQKIQIKTHSIVTELIVGRVLCVTWDSQTSPRPATYTLNRRLASRRCNRRRDACLRSWRSARASILPGKNISEILCWMLLDFFAIAWRCVSRFVNYVPMTYIAKYANTSWKRHSVIVGKYRIVNKSRVEICFILNEN